MKYIFLLISSFAFAQQLQKVDFKTVTANLEIDAVQKTIYGTVSYEFELLSKIDTIRIDAKNMQFSEVQINAKSVPLKCLQRS